MESAQPAQVGFPWLSPVRSLVPIALIVLCLAGGVPLFLRTPLWCDLSLYDLAAKNLLAGGVHFRDIFDTNTPGFVWLLVLIRSVVGWSPEALRSTDLLIVGGIVFSLCRLTRLGGASRLNRLWLVAGCAGFYLFTHEMVHCQRDVWLALPALLAVGERVKRLTRPTPRLLDGVFLRAALEGVLWAVAVWIKPHFLLVAVFVWTFTAPRLAGGGWRLLLTDAGGCLLAGGLFGAAGVGYLMATGTWEPFVQVMTDWNVGYMEYTFGELPSRAGCMLGWFPPWNFLLPLTVAAAVAGMIDARFWSGRFHSPARGGFLHQVPVRWVWFQQGTDEQRYARAVLGALYLAWVAQGLFLQRAYLYVHAVEVLLGMAVLAGYRWNAAALIAGWLLAVQICWVAIPGPLGEWTKLSYDVQTAFTPHPAFDRSRMQHWPACFPPMEGAERCWRLDALKQERNHPASFSWTELDEVAGYLRHRQIGDRELVCWHDSPHALYLLLDVKPGLRFMHVNTARLISTECDHRVCDELRANTAARFVVIDLRWYSFQAATEGERQAYNAPGRSEGDLLPPAASWLRDENRQDGVEPELPFDLSRTVFRSANGRGRYVVFQIKD